MGKAGTSSSSPGFGYWFPFLVHQVPILLAQPDGFSSCSVCHLHPFQINCSGERGCLQPVCRDNVCLYLKMYSAWKDSSIFSCSAFSGYWAVANGGCLQEFFNSATFGQVVIQVEKKHAGVSELACKRTPFSHIFEVPLSELKKPGLVR